MNIDNNNYYISSIMAVPCVVLLTNKRVADQKYTSTPDN